MLIVFHLLLSLVSVILAVRDREMWAFLHGPTNMDLFTETYGDELKNVSRYNVLETIRTMVNNK